MFFTNSIFSYFVFEQYIEYCSEDVRRHFNIFKILQIANNLKDHIITIPIKYFVIWKDLEI